MHRFPPGHPKHPAPRACRGETHAKCFQPQARSPRNTDTQCPPASVAHLISQETGHTKRVCGFAVSPTASPLQFIKRWNVFSSRCPINCLPRQVWLFSALTVFCSHNKTDFCSRLSGISLELSYPPTQSAPSKTPTLLFCKNSYHLNSTNFHLIPCHLALLLFQTSLLRYNSRIIKFTHL